MTGTVRLNFKHLSDDFIQRYKERLLGLYGQRYRKIVLLLDRHTKKFFGTQDEVLVLRPGGE